MSKKSTGVIVAIVTLALIGVGYAVRDQLIVRFFQPTSSTVVDKTAEPAMIQVAAKNLTTPWSIQILPDGDLLISERSGQMKRIGQKNETYPVSGVRETSEGGLLGVALHPKFSENKLLYVYVTTGSDDVLTNQVDQYRYDNDKLVYSRNIIKDIPAAANHDGGAVKFGPDGKLYVTTGDAAREDLAQDRNSLAGKILRLNDDGSVPDDNPFKNHVWSYGHRNPQGIAWDGKDQMWSTEHGPSGVQTGRDELNLIERGANYGWPSITGDQSRDGMKSPIVHSGDNETWAPAGLDYMGGSLYFAGLRGQALYSAKINSNNSVELGKYFSGSYGRLRAVLSDDTKLYVSTSNRDGRGTPEPEDDKILSIPMGSLQ